MKIDTSTGFLASILHPSASQQPASQQDQSVWRNAWLVTPYQLREDGPDSTPGFQACRSADPAMTTDYAEFFCQQLYRDLSGSFRTISALVSAET